MTPMDIEWADGFGYATVAEGEILRLTVDGDRVESTVIASGLEFPRGLALAGDTLFVAELGPLPCENPIPAMQGRAGRADDRRGRADATGAERPAASWRTP